MRAITKALIAFGVVLAVVAGLWALIAPGQLVKYPSDLNKTPVATGTFTLYVDPATGSVRAQPQVLPLTIHRHLYVVSSNGSQAVVKEDDIERVTGLPPLDLHQQYVIDRRSMRDLASKQSYAYSPTNVVNRAPAYSINLPFDTGSGPYQIWKNEVGRSYTFTQQGQPFTRDGIKVIRLQGVLTNAPAQPYYIDQLRPLGLPSQTTIAKLAPQLKAFGVDPAQLTTALLPQLAPADRAAIEAALTKPIGLNYIVSVKTRLLIEPTTGAIVSLDNIDQTLSVQPQLVGLLPLGAILGKPQYRSSPVVKSVIGAILKMLTRPPTVPVFNFNYGQTPASVADIASYTKGKADNIAMVETTIPLALLIAGVLAAGLGLAIVIYDRRARPAGPSDEPPAGGPTGGPDGAPEPTPSRLLGHTGRRRDRHPTTRPSVRG